MKVLGQITDPKDIVNKEYVDNVKKECEEKLNEVGAISNEEIDSILNT